MLPAPAAPAAQAPAANDAKLIQLAREIATDLRPLDDVLKSLAVTQEEWGRIKASPRFHQVLADFVTEWNAAGNTHERTRLKAAMMMEDWLVEAHGRLHDNSENLSAKTELAKLVARLAGMGNDKPADVDTGGKVNITINMGAEKVTFDAVTTKVIDANPD